MLFGRIRDAIPIGLQSQGSGGAVHDFATGAFSWTAASEVAQGYIA
jgi:hypothetical protein